MNMMDTISKSIHRYSGTTLPDYFHREDWVAATLFILFFIIVLAHASSGQSILSGCKDLFKTPKRNELSQKITLTDYLARLLMITTANFVISLLIYTGLTNKSTISPQLFLQISANTLAFFFLKFLSMKFIGFVFLTPDKTRIGITSYFNIIILTGIILYPLLVLKIYLLSGAYSSFFDLAIIVIALIAIVLTTVKIFQLFYIKILDFFYIMLYLCSLEILPFTGMFQVYTIFIRDFNI